MKTSSNQKRNRAHNARPVHAPSHKTVVRSSLGKPPREADAPSGANGGSVSRHTCREPSNASAINLLIAALLWDFAILCALASIAILIHYANSLFGVE